MGSLSNSVSRTTGFIIPAALVVLGSLGATVATDFMKHEVYDIPARGGDAVYPLVAVAILQWVAPRSNTLRLVSLGMTASAVSEAARSYGVI